MNIIKRNDEVEREIPSGHQALPLKLTLGESKTLK